MAMNAPSLWSLEYLAGSWRPEIGDPSFMGWFTVAAYVACAIMAFLAARSRPGGERRSYSFWSLVSLLMLLMAINKQLDLQSLLTEMGRQVARHQGWMEQRRTVQFWFIVCFGALSLAGFAGFVFAVRDLFKRFLLAFIGLFFLLSFIIIRAAGFHHFDEVLDARLLDLKMNWILELGGIFTVLAAAVSDLRRFDNAHPSRESMP
jgi:hypothetical protein